jgi:hypothetical protein
VPSTLESRVNAFRARPAVRRAGIAVMAVPTLVYLVLLAIVILDTPSGRGRWILAAVWCLGLVALLMLVRFWRQVGK